MSSADPDHEDCFKGEERLRLFRPLGRQMRQGDPAELTIPDLLRITDALRSNDRTGAEAYLVLAGQTHHDLVQILFEWAIEWPNTCAQLAKPTEERACTRRAFEIWSHGSESIRESTEGDSAMDLLSDLLEPTTLRPGLSEEFRNQIQSGRHPNLLAPLLRELSGIHTAAFETIRDGDVENAVKRVQTYWGVAVAVHDALVQYSQSYPAAALELKGQVFAERLIHDSFSGSSFFEGLWSLAGSLTPKQLAAWLAEHLRAHFTGPGRGGAVKIVEHGDSYRLIFDACGSGLAMRRRLRSAGQAVENASSGHPSNVEPRGRGASVLLSLRV